MRKNILLTGKPRSGKSFLLSKVVDGIENKKGFLTREIGKGGKRVGFEVIGSEGEKSVLASVDIKLEYKVSRYFVDVDSFDRVFSGFLEFGEGDLLYIDEIGEMELFSERFKKLVRKYLDAPNVFIGTLSAVYSDGFIEETRKRSDVEIIEITPENRERKLAEIVSLLEKLRVKIKG